MKRSAIMTLCAWAWPALAAATQGGDFFLDENGSVTPVVPEGELEALAVGRMALGFAFQATEQDPASGAWRLPELHTVYSLRVVGTDPGAENTAWVYGLPPAGPRPTVVEFDPGTGAGRAVAHLPLGQLERGSPWGMLEEGEQELTLYWGTAAQLAHDFLRPPARAAGRQTWLFHGRLPEVALRFAQNRSMETEVATRLLLMVREPAVEARSFALQSEVPDLYELPVSVTLEAGERLAVIPVLPRLIGEGRVLASSPSFPGRDIVSDVGVVDAPVVALELGGVQNAEINALDLQLPIPRRKCVHPKATSPNGDGAENPEETYCGRCFLTWKPQLPAPDCPPPNGLTRIFFKEGGCFYNEFRSCYPDQEQIDVRQWEYFDVPFLVECALDGTLGVRHKQWCCWYRFTPNFTTIRVKGCRPRRQT